MPTTPFTIHQAVPFVTEPVLLLPPRRRGLEPNSVGSSASASRAPVGIFSEERGQGQDWPGLVRKHHTVQEFVSKSGRWTESFHIREKGGKYGPPRRAPSGYAPAHRGSVVRLRLIPLPMAIFYWSSAMEVEHCGQLCMPP